MWLSDWTEPWINISLLPINCFCSSLFLYSLVAVILALLRSDVEKEMATHSTILAWWIPWTEDPGRPWSLGSQRVGHNRSVWACMHVPIFSWFFHWGLMDSFSVILIFLCLYFLCIQWKFLVCGYQEVHMYQPVYIADHIKWTVTWILTSENLVF